MFDEILKAMYANNNSMSTGNLILSDINSTNIIVSNVPAIVYKNTESKQDFEHLFTSLNPSGFVYLPSFKRVRVSFSTAHDSQMAICKLQGVKFHEQTLKIFCLKTLPVGGNTTLRPPTPEKQFLISPPASPPVGWAPVREDEPVINFDLLQAVAGLEPGTRHELHKATGSTPSVVVDICEDNHHIQRSVMRIPQTKRPNLK